MKKIIRILALALVLVILAGCSGKTETFTCRDLSMKVPAGMKDVSGQQEFSGFTFTLDSAELAIFGLCESFGDYPEADGCTLEDYTKLLIRANGLDCVPTARSGQDYIYFSYTYQAEGVEYRYLIGTYRSEEGFWMIQLSAPAAKYDEAACFAYLDSVEFK